MSETKATPYQLVTDALIARLEAGTAPWRRPWSASRSASGRDRNPVTGTVYKGINRIMTGFQGYGSPLWLSFKQARDLGGSIRKGEKGTLVVYYGRAGGEEDPATGETSGGYLFATKSYVFNLEQTEGLAGKFPDELPAAPRPEFERVETAERIATRYAGGPPVKHSGPQAYYAPQADLVVMPPRETFHTPGGYYSTLFHELAHSTGHRARLNRDSLTGIAQWGDHSYSREELVAEMTASFLLNEAGIQGEELDNSASYLAGWIKVLRGDSRLAVQAANAAEKAANHILGV